MEKARGGRGEMILYVAGFAILVTALALLAFVLRGQGRNVLPGGQVVVAVPCSEWVQDYNSNYYTRWLEEKTGYSITFVYLDESYERESLKLLLTSENSSVDAVFFPQNQDFLSLQEYREYLADGRLASPEEYLAEGSCLSTVRESYAEVDFDVLMGEDGMFYCFPSLSMARTDRNLQVLWINIDWLTNLGYPIPRTAEEFQETLEAFREGDPNGNGVRDEIPLVSCEAENAMQSYLYLINAFTYYDGASLPGGGEVGAAELAAFRRGIAYCAGLYSRGLMMTGDFPNTRKQLQELVNAPSNLVGAFASHSIGDVVYASNPDILSHFVQLAPLSSELSEKGYAIRADIRAGIGGIIPANAVHKEAAAQVMDVMLSEEASLIALYGEEGTDWRFSAAGELSTYGTRARVTTIRYIKGEKQNQNYGGAGPLLAAAEYMDGVTWNGDHSMMEYIDARAVKAYEPYYHESGGGVFRETGVSREISEGEGTGGAGALRKYLEREVLRFITGERDVEDDGDWEKFLKAAKDLG